MSVTKKTCDTKGYCAAMNNYLDEASDVVWGLAAHPTLDLKTGQVGGTRVGFRTASKSRFKGAIVTLVHCPWCGAKYDGAVKEGG